MRLLERTYTANEESAQENGTQVYLVGGGIASLAAAAFLIRDGDIPGKNITILEQLDRLGGSPDSDEQIRHLQGSIRESALFSSKPAPPTTGRCYECYLRW